MTMIDRDPNAPITTIRFQPNRSPGGSNLLTLHVERTNTNVHVRTENGTDISSGALTRLCNALTEVLQEQRARRAGNAPRQVCGYNTRFGPCVLDRDHPGPTHRNGQGNPFA